MVRYGSDRVERQRGVLLPTFNKHKVELMVLPRSCLARSIDPKS